MRLVNQLTLASLLVLVASTALASSEVVEKLRQSMIDNDVGAFGQLLDSGEIDVSDFASNPDLYEVACVATYKGASEFLDRLLEYGLDPSTEDPERSPYRFSLLVCAERANGVEAFVKLVDAGARTDIVLCNPCTTRTPETLVERVLGHPEMFVKITDQRHLTASEMSNIGRNIGNSYYRGTYNDQPLNEFYADFLRERGIDVTPKGPYKPE